LRLGLAKLDVLANEVDEHFIGDVAVVLHDLLIHRNDQERIARRKAVNWSQDTVVKIVGFRRVAAGTPFAALLIKNGVDETAVEGAADTSYVIPNFHVSAHHPQVNVPVLWWRSVGHTHSGFVMETLVDELATRAKMDPIAYRLKLLSPDAKKLRACLTLLEEKSATWRKSVPRNHAVGIACHESFGTGVACAVEISIENKRPTIHRVVIAVDPGFAVNPLSIESQMQGGVTFGMTQVMPKSAITLKDGRVEPSHGMSDVLQRIPTAAFGFVFAIQEIRPEVDKWITANRDGILRKASQEVSDESTPT